MNNVNQRGHNVIEHYIYMADASVEEMREALHLLLMRLDLHVVETNATKHGNTEIQLRENL